MTEVSRADRASQRQLETNEFVAAPDRDDWQRSRSALPGPRANLTTAVRTAPDPRRGDVLHARSSRRKPAWSGGMTTRLATLIPPGCHGATLGLIKWFHTVVFLSVAGLIVLYTWDGATRRAGRRTRVAVTVAVAEAAVYVSNNKVCPLSPLAEELGAENGSVTDILLPTWISRRIPLVSGSVLIFGTVLNLRNWRERRAVTRTR